MLINLDILGKDQSGYNFMEWNIAITNKITISLNLFDAFGFALYFWRYQKSPYFLSFIFFFISFEIQYGD